MKFEKLCFNKVKVTMTTSDMSCFDISIDSLKPDSPQLREFISTLLRRAEAETGFDSVGGCISVEAMPQKDDFIFFITRTDSHEDKDDIKRKLRSREWHVVKKSITSKKPEMSIYRFDSMEAFAELLKLRCDFPESCVLYKSDNTYYLSIPCSAEKAHNLECVMLEFASKIDQKLVAMFLGEHCSVAARGSDFKMIKKCF